MTSAQTGGTVDEVNQRQMQDQPPSPTHVISDATLRRWAQGVRSAADHCDDEQGEEIAQEIEHYGGANGD